MSSIRSAPEKLSRGNPSTNTIGMTACMATATAHRPRPVTRPPTKLMTPIITRAAGGLPLQRKLHGRGRGERQRESEAHRARLFPPGRRKIGDAGRYGAERRRLAGGEAEGRRGDERDVDHADADAHAIDDMLSDEELR